MIAWMAGSMPVFGWGPEGHSLVARIAEAQLTDAVRARVAEILGPGKTMSSVASWADAIRNDRRETYNWHFIDIPIDKPHLDMARDCAKDDCVLAVIPRLRQTLQDPAATAVQKSEALMFLIHFVGDMHQPLHCADNGDKGGNDVKLELYGRPTNLHSIWDSGMLSRIGTEEMLFPVLSKESEKRKKKWRRGTIDDWAEESHRLAQKIVYGKLPKTTPVVIDANYEKIAVPVIRTQLEKGGARLAAVLNATLQ